MNDADVILRNFSENFFFSDDLAELRSILLYALIYKNPMFRDINIAITPLIMGPGEKRKVLLEMILLKHSLTIPKINI